MAKSKPTEHDFAPPGPSKQIAFHQLLVAARKMWLLDALSEAAGAVDPVELKQQIILYAPPDALQILAAAGVRDEEVFPTPILLEHRPTLVGYYRLLLGASQKSFYSGATGMGALKSLEMRGMVNEHQRQLLPAFCRGMAKVLAELVRQLSPTVSTRDVNELRLLTLGSQFYGANNNKIGAQATTDVFLTIAQIVQPFVQDRTERRLTLRNASGRKVVIALASDPDVRIEEEFGDRMRNTVAIEIKGGTDRSNAHNRAGEAEKSHQKARREDFRDFWTLIALKGIDPQQLRKESPTTTSWFDVAQVLARAGSDFEDFRSRIAGAVGIPLDQSAPLA